MDYQLKIVNSEAFIKALSDMQCGKSRFAEIDAVDFEIPAFEIQPPEGYQAPKNFPCCCEYHQHIFESLQAWFDKFPGCCKAHERLLTASWFHKSSYEGIAHKVLNQLSYTEHLLSKQIGNADWYEDITDYIAYNHSSFGQLPTGYGPPPGLSSYLDNLQYYLKNINESGPKIPSDKAKRLQQFVASYYKPPGNEKVDFNMLDNIYKNWLKIFPFNISYFKQIKGHFQRQFPILKGTPTTNRYSGLTKIKVKTQLDLIEWLNKTTKSLLESVNSAELVKNGLITDSEKHTVELISENHRIKQDSLLINFNKGEIEYVKVLKKWMTNEKNYFKELTLFLKVEHNHAPKVQYPPVNEDVFEDLVCDLFNAMYPQCHYERFGKKGNAQKGIDILSVPRKEAIQCKKKDLSRRSSIIKNELRNDFEGDILTAMDLEVEIGLLIFASTFENNASLEEHLQKLKKKHKPKFDLMYMGWNTLASHLHSFPTLVKKYCG